MPASIIRIFLFAAIGFNISCNPGSTPGVVQSLDPAVEITLFAEQPALVTPIGIAVHDNKIYVLESHTHTPPEDYAGPETDVIKILRDTDRDGVADEFQVYCDGFEDGMNLHFAPDGRLMLVAAKGVWALSDVDEDGVCDSKIELLSLVEPESVYDHAALLGITIAADGWMYVARGNTGGNKWKLVGTDGSFVEGYGDGGNIVRSRLDGSRLEEVATGFWNPFDLTLTSSGHLLAVDNDPDSRGPNRMIDIIPGADFGYKSMYGGSGLHPYLAWNGELLGTLPYASALGEAPSGIFDLDESNLPAQYAGSVLISIWEESKLVYVPLQKNGVSVGGSSIDLVVGDESFRPVAFAADNAGNVYVTDWAQRTYPNHGRGRIWRIRATNQAGGMQPESFFEKQVTPQYQITKEQLHTEGSVAIESALGSADPYLRTIARDLITQSASTTILATSENVQARREAAFVALSSQNNDAGSLALSLLQDDDVAIRQLALSTIGSQLLVDAEPAVHNALAGGQITPSLFDSYLATIRHLQPAFVSGYKTQAETNAKRLVRTLPDGFLKKLVLDDNLPGEIRAAALLYMPEGELANVELSRLLETDNSPLISAALWKLRNNPVLSLRPAVVNIALDNANSETIRVEALQSLATLSSDEIDVLKPLLQESADELTRAFVRQLGSQAGDNKFRLVLEKLWEEAEALSPAVKEQIAIDLGYEQTVVDLDVVAEVEAGNGSAVIGRQVFFASQAQCSLCHRFDLRGGTIGPDLSNVGQSKSPAQLLDAVIDPSLEVSPEWQGWFVETAEGKRFTGRQIDVGLTHAELMLLDGSFQKFDNPASYGVLEQSLMPAGLDKLLTQQDLIDLVTFLASAK